MVQHYELAFNSYHAAKREFNNDHAWVYFAGALVSFLRFISANIISMQATGTMEWYNALND